MPDTSDNKIPEDIASEIEKLVAGEGPFEDVDESRLRRTEDLSQPSLDDPQAEDAAELSMALVLSRLEALEQAAAEPVYEKPMLLPDEDYFWAYISGNAADGTNRWKYAWSEYYKSTAGYGGWAAVTDGRSGTTTTDPARNTIEDMNTGADAHVEGNGIDPANLDPASTGSDTFEIMPCTAGNIVLMFVVSQGEDTEYWFSYENGVDGGCS